MTDEIVSAELEALLAEFARSGVRELHLRRGSFELYLSSDPAARSGVAQPAERAPSAAPRAAALPEVAPARAAAALPVNAFIVTAPNLGTFYRSPKPGAAAYVELGATIERGAELCLIEVMKLFTAVRAERGGRVHAILAEDGAMVEAGQPLFAIVPAA